jgi:hypothetical protein
MTLRTVQITGMGFGATPAEVSVTVDGNVVYAGEVTTQNAVPWALPNNSLSSQTAVLCTFTLPKDFSGEKAMSCSVNNGTVIFSDIKANYNSVANPVFTKEEFIALGGVGITPTKLAIYSAHAVTPFSTEEIAILESADPTVRLQQDQILYNHGVSMMLPGDADTFSPISLTTDARNDVQLNGVPVTPDHTDYQGTWWWVVNSGSTLSYNLEVAAVM